MSHRLERNADATAPNVGVRPAAAVWENEFEGILQKLKLLEYGLYGLQQLGRSAPLDAEDLGPFFRLAEEIQGDVLALRERLVPPGTTGPDA